MKEITYAYLCEDIAIEIFLKNFLVQYSRELTVLPHLSFVEVIDFPIAASNNKQVEKRIREAAIMAFKEYNTDVFFAGLDNESSDVKKSDARIKLMRESLSEKDRTKTVILIPIQCIEHWLLYLKDKRENPSKTKREVFESKERSEVKTKVYGNKNLSKEKRIPVINELTLTMEINWLISRSNSFKHFVGQFSTFVKSVA
ncbi:MAG: hypothetical protein AABZ32_06245 [Bacteroidota bacterium]